ncbi:addiction module antidote protein [Deferrisoma palaeochoriense]
MPEKFTRWDPVDYLKTPEDIARYLTACVHEDTGDGKLIQAALGDIARARNMASLARATGLSREGLYKALSESGNPRFATILKVARAVGLEVEFRPATRPEGVEGD